MTTVLTDPGAKRQLDDERGLWLFWRDHPDGRGRQGLACTLWACPEPTCPCTEFVGRARWLDDRIATVQSVPGDLRLRFADGAEPADDGPTYARCAFRWDRTTGKVAHDHGAEHEFAVLAAWLEAEFDDELRASFKRALARRRNPAATGATPKPDPWADWQPGDLASYVDHFPSEGFAPIDLEGKRYAVEDLHCIHRECDCTDVRFVVYRLDDGAQPPIGRFAGSLAVSLPSLAPNQIDPEPSKGGRPTLLAAWHALEACHPDLVATLEQRRRRMKQLRPPRRTRARAASEPARRQPQPGRNDPCSCGSGRKFKKCCGAR